jgi:hypothetical protein
MDSIKRLARRATWRSQSTTSPTSDWSHETGITPTAEDHHNGVVKVYDWGMKEIPSSIMGLLYEYDGSEFTNLERLEEFLSRVTTISTS